jgi:hypothetical protein
MPLDTLEGAHCRQSLGFEGLEFNFKVVYRGIRLATDVPIQKCTFKLRIDDLATPPNRLGKMSQRTAAAFEKGFRIVAVLRDYLLYTHNHHRTITQRCGHVRYRANSFMRSSATRCTSPVVNPPRH